MSHILNRVAQLLVSWGSDPGWRVTGLQQPGYMRNLWFKLAIVLSLFALSSCSSLSTSSQGFRYEPYVNRVQQLKQIHHFQASGALIIKTPTFRQGINFNWQQDDSNYHISLFGPLGLDAVEIQGDQRRVLLRNSQGQTYRASTPEALMQQYMHWHLPVTPAAEWVLGMPADGVSQHRHYDAYGHLQSFQQDGWTITYVQYTVVSSHYDLPTVVILQSPDAWIRVTVSAWKIPTF